MPRELVDAEEERLAGAVPAEHGLLAYSREASPQPGRLALRLSGFYATPVVRGKFSQPAASSQMVAKPSVLDSARDLQIGHRLQLYYTVCRVRRPVLDYNLPASIALLASGVRAAGLPSVSVAEKYRSVEPGTSEHQTSERTERWVRYIQANVSKHLDSQNLVQPKMVQPGAARIGTCTN